MVSLTKTTRWRNLKRTGKNLKDLKEQATINDGVMATVEVLDNNIEQLVGITNKTKDILQRQHDVIINFLVPLFDALNKDPQIAEIFKKNLTKEQYNYIFGKGDQSEQTV